MQVCVAPIATRSSNYPVHFKNLPPRKKSFVTFMVSKHICTTSYGFTSIRLLHKYQPTTRCTHEVLKYWRPHKCRVVYEGCLFCGQDGLAQGAWGTVHVDGLREATVSAFDVLHCLMVFILPYNYAYAMCSCTCFLTVRVGTFRWTFTGRAPIFRIYATRPHAEASR